MYVCVYVYDCYTMPHKREAIPDAEGRFPYIAQETLGLRRLPERSQAEPDEGKSKINIMRLSGTLTGDAPACSGKAATTMNQYMLHGNTVCTGGATRIALQVHEFNQSGRLGRGSAFDRNADTNKQNRTMVAKSAVLGIGGKLATIVHVRATLTHTRPSECDDITQCLAATWQRKFPHLNTQAKS